jgi:hypothetical protein
LTCCSGCARVPLRTVETGLTFWAGWPCWSSCNRHQPGGREYQRIATNDDIRAAEDVALAKLVERIRVVECDLVDNDTPAEINRCTGDRDQEANVRLAARYDDRSRE